MNKSHTVVCGYTISNVCMIILHFYIINSFFSFSIF
nr:MAG TPA: hypothetical protein [Caudoviricetes sp.]